MKRNDLMGPSLATTALLASFAFSSLHCGGIASGSASNANSTTTSGAATTKSCDVSTQPVCPSTVPSFAADVNTIFNNYCMQCHSPNGVGAATSGPGGGGARNPNDPNGMLGNPNLARDPNGFNSDPNHWDPADGHDWSKYANIKANATLIEQQVFLCNMPPAGAPAISDADKQTLLNWLKCGAPNN